MKKPPPPVAIVARERAAFVPAIDLWLDPPRARDWGFVSHAHADHFARHRRLLCSRPTRTLIEARYAPKRTEFVALDFGEPLDIGGHRLRLYPAGHIAGSAQLHVESLATGASLLYTGDFKARPGHAAEAPEWPRADTLVMETTFGHPRYRLPAAEEVVAGMGQFVRETWNAGAVPVLLCYSLGKAQETILALERSLPGPLKWRVHPAVEEMNRAVAGLGFPLPVCETFDPKTGDPLAAAGPDEIVMMPPMARRFSAGPSRDRPLRVAMITGWGIDPSARYRFGVDAVFPLSDHADYDDLHRCVERVAPRRVYTVHGYTKEFAADLRRNGWDAWSLEGGDQIELDLFADD